MVQHIGSKFSLPKNIPLLAVAVGRIWGFFFFCFFSDPPRSHAQDGRQWSWNALLCNTLCPSPHPPTPRSLFLFFYPSLYLSMHWDLWITYSGKTPRGNRIPLSGVQFQESALLRLSRNVRRKSNRIISGDLLIFRIWHIVHSGGEEKKLLKNQHIIQHGHIIPHSFSRTLGRYSLFFNLHLCLCKNCTQKKKIKYMERTFRQTIIILLWFDFQDRSSTTVAKAISLQNTFYILNVPLAYRLTSSSDSCSVMYCGQCICENKIKCLMYNNGLSILYENV